MLEAVPDRACTCTHTTTGKAIVASEFAGTDGVPVLVSNRYFRVLLSLTPSRGCKGVILSHRADSHLLPCPQAEMDIDTAQDLTRLSQAALNPPAN